MMAFATIVWFMYLDDIHFGAMLLTNPKYYAEHKINGNYLYKFYVHICSQSIPMTLQILHESLIWDATHTDHSYYSSNVDPIGIIQYRFHPDPMYQ